MKAVFAALLSVAALASTGGTASAQYYGPPGGYYNYGSPAGLCCALQPINLGWIHTRAQPAGDGGPHPAMQMEDGTLACEFRNYRPMRDGVCRRIW